MLTTQNRLDIYSLLSFLFRKDKELPLKEVEEYLSENGLHYQEFGYKNIESLIEDLKEFLALKKNGSRKNVVFHSYVDSDAEEMRNKKTPSKQQKKTSKNKGKNSAASENSKDSRLCERRLLDTLINIGHYQIGKEYALATLSKTLLDNGVVYKDYGFGKLKDMIANYPEGFSIRNVKQNGVVQPMITILKTVDPEPKKEEKVIKSRKDSVQRKSEGSTYPEEFYIPDKLILSLRELTGSGIGDTSLGDQVKKDYLDARKKGKVQSKDDCIYFQLSLRTRDGKELIGAVRKSDSNTIYSHYLSYIGMDKDKPGDVMRLTVHFNDYEGSINELRSLARKESWCYHNSKDKNIILKIYLQYTFYRLVSQNKIAEDKEGNFACFHTGLVNIDYEPIYGVMVKNKDNKFKEKYLFQGFAVAGSQGLGKMIVEHFSPLPSRASYVEKVDDLFLPSDVQLHTDFKHVIIDNIDRFPIEVIKKLSAPFADESKIVNLISKEKNSYKVEKLYSKLRDSLRNNQIFYSLIKTTFEMALNKGMEMLRYDYRIVLPSFFPTRNVLSLMLPLSFLKNSGEVDAVLLIEKTASGNYQGQTILNLKQCYVNSRLITPLLNTYLDPDKIED